MICGLDKHLEESEFGAKAAGLSRLISYGMRVPDGFAISKRIHSDYLREGIFKEVNANLTSQYLALLTTELVIVRSSAVGEDGAEYSFAGQLDSFTVANNKEDVLEAVEKCWQSLEYDRVKAYASRAGYELSEMGVIIQEFLEPEYAGVFFTKSPMGRESWYVEYVAGRGEALVSGKLTPVTIEPGYKQATPFSMEKLLQGSIGLKNKYNTDLDIEWICCKGEIYFVQARPITTEVKTKIYWSNTNLNENYPNPISPLLYSIARDSYYHYFKNLAGLLQLSKNAIRDLEYDFSNAVGIWGNRIYYNMSSIHNILSASPLRSYFIDAFNKFVGYEEKDVTSADYSSRSSMIRLVWRLIKLNFRLKKNVKEIEDMVTSFSAQVDKGDKPHHELFYAYLRLRFHEWYRASLADFFAMIYYKLLGVFAEKFYGAEHLGVHNTMLQAIPDLISTEPLNEIYKITEMIRSDREMLDLFENESAEVVLQKVKSYPILDVKTKEYLRMWGFRCSGELMFTTRNYVDQPVKFIELIQVYLQQKVVNPTSVLLEKAQVRRRTKREFMRKIFLKYHVLFPVSIVMALVLHVLYKRSMRSIAARERVRYKQAEMYYKFRKVVQQIGLRYGIGDDAFFLTYKEIGELISSSGMVSIDLEARKKAYSQESKLSFPEHFSTYFGERPSFVVREVGDGSSDNVFKGLAASGGRIQGRVKILESVLESGKLEQGDILVTKQTDPGWAMVFPIIAGLIVERGGALSHGAIVAREFGIPAVVGVSGIAQILKDDDEVLLDGDLGKIEMIKKSESEYV